MSMSDKVAAFLARNQKQNRAADRASANTTTITGIAAADSENGSVAVIIPGADVVNPEDKDGNQIGDNTVIVPIIGSAQEGDEITILGVGNGIADVPVVVGGAGSGDRTRKMAEDAQEAIDATNQHFYDDSNGVHVVTEDGDPTTGPNLLANSYGVLLRNGTLIMSAQTPSGFSVYDGLGNNAANILAQFGAVITLGKSGEQQLVLDQDAFELLNVSGSPFFHVGYSDDAIGPQGTPVTAPFLLFDITGSIASRTIGAYSVAFGTDVHAENFASAAFGVSSTASGFNSFAAGADVEAEGQYSAAFGDGTVTKNWGEFACGNYNEIDTTGFKLFSVGDGAQNSRLDAFAVLSGGDVKTSKGYLQTKPAVLYENANGAGSGLITLSDAVHNYDEVRIYFKDPDNVTGSASIYKPQNGTNFCSLQTSNVWDAGSGLAVKTRTVMVWDKYIQTKNEGTNYEWGGQALVYNGSTVVGGGTFIYITAVLGFKY